MRSVETSTIRPHQFLTVSTPQSALIAHGRREDSTPTWDLILISLPRIRKSLTTSYSIASVKNVLDGQLSDETNTLKYTRSGMILTKPTVESTTQDPANIWNQLLQKRIWSRSVKKRKLCYTTFIGDGDSKIFQEVCEMDPYNGVNHS